MAIPLPTWENARADSDVRCGAEIVVQVLESLGVELAFGVMGGGSRRFAVRSQRARSRTCTRVTRPARRSRQPRLARERQDRARVHDDRPGPDERADRHDGGALRRRARDPRQRRHLAEAARPWTVPGDQREHAAADRAVLVGPAVSLCDEPRASRRARRVAQRLAVGLARPGGFVAHVSVPLALQTARCAAPPRVTAPVIAAPRCELSAVVAALREPFAIWIGHGARDAAHEVRRLVEHTGAVALCSPRGKGIIPDDHPQLLGTTGLGGHAHVESALRDRDPRACSCSAAGSARDVAVVAGTRAAGRIRPRRSRSVGVRRRVSRSTDARRDRRHRAGRERAGLRVARTSAGRDATADRDCHGATDRARARLRTDGRDPARRRRWQRRGRDGGERQLVHVDDASPDVSRAASLPHEHVVRLDGPHDDRRGRGCARAARQSPWLATARC